MKMRVFDDKLSIWNEGGLPFGLSLEDLKSDHNSRPRNPIIANACFFAGYIDTCGRGTLKIINSCKEAGLPDLEIKEMIGGVEVTIYLQTIDGAIGGQTDGQTGSLIGDQLTERQIEVLKLIKENNKISRKDIAKKLDIAESAVQKHIMILTEAKIIERVGKYKGYWKIIQK